jgi:hypothetical protein
MQQHLHKAQVGLWCHKRSVRPFYAVGGGEAAQLCAYGRYGRQIQPVRGVLQSDPLDNPVRPGGCFGGAEVR